MSGNQIKMHFEGANQAKIKITEDDTFLAAVAAELGLLPMLLSVVHMTGDLGIIRGLPTKPSGMGGDFSGQIPGDIAAELRARALAAMRQWRDAGCPPPFQPSEAELSEMINFLVGAPVPAKYFQPILEDMGYWGDARAIGWDYAKAKDAAPLDVLIIGAGMSGIAMAYRLKAAKIPFRIIEKNDGVGGTWHENRYPGCRVDIGSHAYSFNSTQDYPWPNLYSMQPELKAYFEHCVDRFGLRGNVELNTKVIAARYDEAARLWQVTLSRADGGIEQASAAILISAVGLLNIPAEPGIEGMEKFAGKLFHTARWPEGLDTTGKRIAVIGNGATAIQAIPELARSAGHLSVFQRTANWCAINPNYEREITAIEQWAFTHLPYFSGWLRAKVFHWHSDLTNAHIKTDPAWPQDGLSVSATNKAIRDGISAQVRQRLATRPDIYARVIPDHPPFSKRPCIGSGAFFDALVQPNVELITNGITRFDETGIVDGDGRHHEIDIAVLATGFQVQNFIGTLNITGKGGIALKDYWGEDAAAYLGVTVPHFPNFFIMYGPGTNFGFNGNLIWLAEIQARYIVLCLKMMTEAGCGSLEVLEDRYREYDDRMQAEMASFVTATTHAGNYFKNSSGKVTANMPWYLVDYWAWLQQPDPTDFLETARAPADAVPA